MNKRQTYLPVIIAASLIAGMLLANLLFEQSFRQDVYKPGKENKINAILDYIEESYVDTVNRKHLVENAIPEFLEELDPHSIYIPAEKVEAINEPLEGNFEGIGVQFNIRKDSLLILHTISGGPSEKAGLKAGDRIVTVNDSVIAGVNITTEEIMKLLKGPKGTKVEVGILRLGVDSLLHYTIIRDEIPLYSVEISYMPGDSIGYIKINSFSNTTHQEFMNAVAKLRSRGMNRLILDLRGNSGGYMDAATNIIDEFLRGEQLIVYTEGRKYGKNSIYSTDSRGLCKHDAVVVLIDEFSASASEIVAGAIQDNDRGWVVGRRSFGKGLVQEPVSFTDGSQMRLTTARYYTPSGRCIQKPYDDGIDTYYEDILKRYQHGEFMEADSIQFADSLKYTTKNGRTVYGGGGIMPDIFVPVDTSGMSRMYNAVHNKNMVYEFAYQYTDRHRKQLNACTDLESLEKYFAENHVFADFAQYIKEHGITYGPEEIDIASRNLQIQIQAAIARNIINDKGFYPIIHQIDKPFQKAMDILEKSKKRPV